MDPQTHRFILDTLAQNNVLTLATNRDDGWPQATTVAYANDGFTIYVVTFPQAQKIKNIQRDDRVSLTVDHDESDWNHIKGLSMAAHAHVLDDKGEIARGLEFLARKFPQMAGMGAPESADYVILKITPRLISVLNYEKGFGHTELVEV